MGFDVVRENQISNTVPPDHVIDQSIAADVEVKPKQILSLDFLEGPAQQADQDFQVDHHSHHLFSLI